jgi:hypothetical protein
MIVAKFSSVLSDKKIFQQVYRRMTTTPSDGNSSQMS